MVVVAAAAVTLNLNGLGALLVNQISGTEG